MNMCSENHDEIVFEGEECPLCEALSTVGSLEMKVNSLESDLESAENDLDSANEMIATLKANQTES